MSCDNTQWQTAANDYAAAMTAVNTKCLAVTAAQQDVLDAQEALSVATAALAAAEDAQALALAAAATSQTRMLDEAEKLGVVCECPEVPVEPEPERTRFPQ